MIRWLNRHRWAMPSVEGAVLAYLLFGPLWNDLLSWPAALSVLLVGAVTVAAQTSLLHSEEHQALSAFDECAPEALEQFCREVSALYPPRRKSDRQMWLGMKLNEAAALSDLGERGRAESVLQELEPWLEGERYPVFHANFQLSRAALALQRERPGEAAPLLRQAEETLRGVRLPADTESRWDDALAGARWECDFLNDGASEALLDQALHRVSAARTLRLQVAARLDAGRCLLGLHRPAEARPYLEFAAARGGRTDSAQQARQLLNSLRP